MAANSSLPPESHYDPNKLGKIFAVVAVVLLLAIIGLFVKDYSRQWKEYQRQYRAMEVEKTRVKLDEQQGDLAKNEEYQKVMADLKAAQTKLTAETAKLNAARKEADKAEAVVKIHVQQSQFVKAEFDALKYRYEQAAANASPKASALKIQLETLAAKIQQLRVKIEEAKLVLKQKQAVVAEFQQDIKALTRKRSEFAKKADIIENKLKKIDIEQMSPANQLADIVRDLPIIDLANPNYKIRQIVLKDIPEDVNFMKVQRVDRCTTCHLGIDNPDFKNAPQPLTAHPNLELFMGKNSPHSLEEFGCTTCHSGRGRATDFISAAHTPSDSEEARQWKKKYGWAPLSHWDKPMLSSNIVQAGCFKCHENQTVIKGAEKLNLGMNLIEKSGCYNCHEIKKYKDWPKSGPNLDFIASKSTKQWAWHWIDDPKSIRFNTSMPSYFHQSNNSDPVSVKRGHQEVHAIVEYLFTKSKPFAVSPIVNGDPIKGKELVDSLGCLACHQVQPVKTEAPLTRESLQRAFGPNLIGLGSKTNKEWLHQWLMDPSKYHDKTRMPNMRLSSQEASDITAYLMQDKSEALAKPVPPVDEKVLDGILFDFLKKSNSLSDTQAKIKAMTLQEKLVYAGGRLIRDYGCFSCHQISGFENDKPIGVELTEEGDKDPHQLDFGFTHIEHTKEAWFKQKLLDPRIFDNGKRLEHSDKSKMPNFNFTKEEAEAVTTALMGLVRDRPSASKLAGQNTRAVFINEGAKTIRQFNCQSCHMIDGEGGAAIQKTVNEWLVTYQGKDANDAKAITGSFSPPSLMGEGAKIQPQWLFEFLHSPTTHIRPWLKVRMPTYYFHTAQINSIVKYFNYLDKEEFPFTDIYHPHMTDEELAGAQKLFSKDYFNCASCHIVGDQMPGGTPDGWAPDLALGAKRLKPEWIVRWITNPAAIQPGTKMPTFYDPGSFEASAPPDVLNGDPRRQIKVLRDYLLTITEHYPKASSKDGQSATSK